tara:strand:+ start:582 stop:1265 length:684 start_codon:yes stop_codon:yes gene_type:complete
MNSKIIKISNLSKSYYQNKTKIIILKNTDFSVSNGDIISILGPSGSGKSTLLNILGLLDSHFLGDYYFLQQDTRKLNSSDKSIIMNKSIGFVHQFFHLIPELNVLENVSLPNLINGISYNKSQINAKDILVNFGLQDRIIAKPNNLSGGERQRVAIARALINDPDIIFADEMTGNLDQKTSDTVFNFFLEKIKSNSKTLIFATHNKEYAKLADKIFQINKEDLYRIA